MTAPEGDRVARRGQRKQDLLLVSQLTRTEVVGAFDDLAARADAVGWRIARIRRRAADPRVWLVAGAAGGLLLAVAWRRVSAARMVRWAWGAWWLWRRAAAFPRGWRFGVPPGRGAYGAGSGRGLPSRSIAT